LLEKVAAVRRVPLHGREKDQFALASLARVPH